MLSTLAFGAHQSGQCTGPRLKGSQCGANPCNSGHPCDGRYQCMVSQIFGTIMMVQHLYETSICLSMKQVKTTTSTHAPEAEYHLPSWCHNGLQWHCSQLAICQSPYKDDLIVCTGMQPQHGHIIYKCDNSRAACLPVTE